MVTVVENEVPLPLIGWLVEPRISVAFEPYGAPDSVALTDSV